MEIVIGGMTIKLAGKNEEPLPFTPDNPYYSMVKRATPETGIERQAKEEAGKV